MIRNYIALFIVFVSLAAFSETGNRDSGNSERLSLSNLKEFHRRDGLPNIFHKISTQRQIKIAYLGGSITAASEGWRGLTFDWFRLNYPHTAFYQINSAIGGTGSLLGVFRIDALLAEKPDLIFVEFAVNDENEMSVNRRIQSMEGIVRKTWEALPNTDICFVYTTAVKFCTTLIQEGKQFDAVLDHEKVANHYGIPSIDMGIEVARLCNEGKAFLTADPLENAQKIVFFSTNDHYHPLTESGHPVYAGTVVKYLQRMSGEADSKKHPLPTPFVTDNWQKSQIINPEQTQLQGDWVKIPKNQIKQFGTASPLWKAGSGAKMKFKFEGTELGIYDCIGPGTGIVEVTIDGKSQEVTRFDGFCSYWRSNFVFLNGLAEGIHDVEIKVTGEEFDKKITIKPGDDSAQYAMFDWFPIGILIAGKLIK